MVDVLRIDDLAIFLIFFLPGFVSIKVYDLLVRSERRDFSKDLFEAMAYSTINFALLFWLIHLFFSTNFDEGKIRYFLYIILILFVFPSFWPICFIKISSWVSIARYTSYPKPWDHVFSKGDSYWVIVHLKDGRMIGGVYDQYSFSSSYPAEEEIYLEEVWKSSCGGAPRSKLRGMLRAAALVVLVCRTALKHVAL